MRSLEHLSNILMHSEYLDKWGNREEELYEKVEEEYPDWKTQDEVFRFVHCQKLRRGEKMEEKKRDYVIIGDCEVNEKGEIIRLDRGWYRQGWVYKNEEAYYTDKSAVCYVPELEDAIYTGQDILDMCNGQPEIADRVFEAIDWEHPSSYLDDQDSDELCQCECGKWYWCYGVNKCPFCGAENPNAANLCD